MFKGCKVNTRLIIIIVESLLKIIIFCIIQNTHFKNMLFSDLQLTITIIQVALDTL